MARMIPEKPSPGCSPAEEDVFRALQSALDQDYLVFHQVRWEHRERANRPPRSCEADFILVHPDRGVLILEVKGGGIEFDPSGGKWYSINRRGEKNPMNDPPLEQAMGNAKRLLEHFKNSPRLPAAMRDRFLVIGYCVVWPDCRVGNIELPARLPGELVIDRDGLGSLLAKVAEVYDYHTASRRGPGGIQRPAKWGDQGIALLQQIFVKRVRIPVSESRFRAVRPPMGQEIEREKGEFLELNEKQRVVLEALEQWKRLLVTGCAGSGKTFLALEHAKNIAARGMKVLFLCYNKSLASALRNEVEGVERLEVIHFHSLCFQWAKEVGIDFSGPSTDPTVLPGDFFDAVLPEVFTEAIERMPRRYDAIFVDEAQDFQETWWIPIESLLRSEEHGMLYMFCDDGQGIYGGEKVFPTVQETPHLSQNLRNTKKIHEVVKQFSPRAKFALPIGPEGRPVEFLSYNDERSFAAELSRVLHRLTAKEKIHSNDIAVLTFHRLERLPFEDGKVGKFRLVTEPPSHECEVFTSTIHAFKGLESPVVILTDLQEHEFLTDELLYVGCSRARHHLVLLYRRELESRFRVGS